MRTKTGESKTLYILPNVDMCLECKHEDRTEHEYPCCICTRLNAVRTDHYEPKEKP